MTVSSLKQITTEVYTIAFEDGTGLRSTLNVIADFRLYSGCEIDAERHALLIAASSKAIAFRKAAEILSRRPMSCKELRDKLIRKGESEETADYCVRRMVETGLMDDGAYASAVARHYTAKGYGAGRVRAELSRRGVSRDYWEETISRMPVREDKIDHFIAARLKDPNDRDQIRKVSNSLYRRGFSWEEIRSALSRYSTEYKEED